MIEALLRCEGRGILLVHRAADLDAVSSALALRRGLEKLNPEITLSLAVPDRTNRAVRQFYPDLSIEINPVLDCDFLVILDTSTPELLKPVVVEDFGGEIFLVDHHAPNHLLPLARHSLVDPGASSTSELVLRILDGLGVELDAEIKKSLLLGILSDTRVLRIAPASVVKTVGQLLSGLEEFYNQVVPKLLRVQDRSERIAHLKAASRMEVRSIGRYLVALSRVGSHSATAASALISLGADCAIVGGKDGGKTKISVRGSEAFLTETGTHLGRDVAGELGRLLGGTGGGVRGAGAVEVEGELELVIEKAFELVKRAVEAGTDAGGR
jgi:nanoRNase/pAp phosphatase (c-di-AMP/oligoRNAs hydrolase)